SLSPETPCPPTCGPRFPSAVPVASRVPRASVGAVFGLAALQRGAFGTDVVPGGTPGQAAADPRDQELPGPVQVLLSGGAPVPGLRCRPGLVPVLLGRGAQDLAHAQRQSAVAFRGQVQPVPAPRTFVVEDAHAPHVD